MITVVLKSGEVHGNMDGEAERDGQILMVFNEDGLIAEFNDSWAYWFEHENKIDGNSNIRQEE